MKLPTNLILYHPQKAKAMKIDELLTWEFDQPPTEGCAIQCPECGKWTNHIYWIESEVGCEDCGSHAAMKCPHCDEEFDHVGQNEPFKVRQS